MAKVRQCVVGLGSLQERSARPLSEAVKMKPIFQWESKMIGDVRAMEHLPRTNMIFETRMIPWWASNGRCGVWNLLFVLLDFGPVLVQLFFLLYFHPPHLTLRIFTCCHCMLEIHDLSFDSYKGWQWRHCFEFQRGLEIGTMCLNSVWPVKNYGGLWKLEWVCFALWDGHDSMWAGNRCYDLNVKCSTLAHVFKHLIPSW